MLDLAMDIPMLLDITTLARGLLMPSPRPRRMLPFSMVLMDMLATLMPGENKLLTR